MNILIPNQWLREYLKTEAAPDQIRSEVSLCGPSVERIETVENDQVFDVEVTTNRVDCMSIRGFAREAAVILTQAGLPSQLVEPETLDRAPELVKADQQLPLPKINIKTGTDAKGQPLCRRILTVVLEVKNQASPDWMIRRIAQTGHGTHDVIIDITNYITHELGHPCHVFDYDQIMKLGGEINIEEARAGLHFRALDKTDHKTVGGEIVFTNPKGEIIDLPAVIGTLNTAVSEKTTRVLFWIENLNPEKVRFASMTHAIRTNAATLNEKNVDPFLAQDVFYRGLQLYRDLAEAKIASDIYTDFPFTELTNGAPFEPAFFVPWDVFPQYLGIDIPHEQIIQILDDLGITIHPTENIGFTAQPPTWRSDLKIPADIVEEVARIYGYHRLPSNLDFATVAIPAQKEYSFVLESNFQHFLAARGYQEIYQYSTVSAELAELSGTSLEQHLKLTNPLTIDRIYLRTSLLPSLLEIFEQNHDQPTQLFELAKTYHAAENLEKIETLNLSLLSFKPYREVLADFTALIDQYYLTITEIKEVAPAAPIYRQTGEIWLSASDQEPFLAGQIHLLKNDCVGLELALETIVPVAKNYPIYQPIITTPTITEDLTFVLKPETKVGDILKTIRDFSPLIVKVELKDIYQDRYTFRLTYQDPQKPLSGTEVAPLRADIVNQLANQFSASLVGTL